VIERLALIALNLVSYVLLARLLTPEEIGLYSVAAALVGVLQTCANSASAIFSFKQMTFGKNAWTARSGLPWHWRCWSLQ